MNSSITGLLTVSQINKSVLQGTILNDIIKEQLLMIDKKILNYSKKIGENEIMYDLPIIFSNTAANTVDTKIIIYYHIIQNLENRGFDIRADLTKDKAIISIKWTIGLDRSTISSMESYLQTKSI